MRHRIALCTQQLLFEKGNLLKKGEEADLKKKKRKKLWGKKKNIHEKMPFFRGFFFAYFSSLQLPEVH